MARCPDALVINLTNPAGIVQQTVEAGWPGLRIVSACDAPVTFARAISERLGRPYERVLRRCIGMNHCGWYVPEDPAELPLLAGLVTGMDPGVVDAHQALPAPYVRYYVDPDRQLEAQRGHESRAQQLKAIDAALLDAYASGPSAERRKRGAAWYGLVVTPLIDGWLHGSDAPMVLGARNNGRLPEAPDSTVIEICHRLTPGRLEPLEPPERPALPALMLAHSGAYEQLAVAALAGGGSSDARLRAMLANPMVRGWRQATGLLAEIESRSPRG
jgi:6-phospho-beta-glucosidase